LKISPNKWTRPGLAALSGLALAAAFPKIDMNLCAWVAFVPLFYAMEGQSLRRVFGYALLQGFVCYVGSLYWVVIALHDFASVPTVLAIMPMLLLAAIMGTYTAVAIWSGEFTARRLGMPSLLTMPIAWTALEWVRTYFPIGFPWNLLGYAAYRNVELIQFAEFTGVYGVSALIMFFNVVAYAADSDRWFGHPHGYDGAGVDFWFVAYPSAFGDRTPRFTEDSYGSGRYTSIAQMGPEIPRNQLRNLSHAKRGGGAAGRRPYRMA
jgi:apolipoprotein N-acyltransferase